MTHADFLRILVERHHEELRRGATRRRLLRQRRIASASPERGN